jgi:choline dehydrogenase-like flavoprotein
MILNLSEIKARTGPIEVAIVGAGAAGLTIANALIGSGLNVLVIEAGGERTSARTQEPYEGLLADPSVHPWLHHFRVRAVGGASRIWGGRCVPFDPIDFANRPWVPGPGWPFPLAGLTQYYEAAQVAAEAGDFDYDPRSALPGHPAEFAKGLDSDWLQTRLERFSKPTNFYRRFGPNVRRDPHVHLVMDTPVTRIALAPGGGTVDHLDLRAPDGSTFELRAERYVLAMGGLETVRLMLASDDVKSRGVGGDSGHLGRFYMSHLAATAGRIRFNRPNEVAFDYERDAAGVYVRRRVVLSAKAQRAIGALNIAFRTHLPDPADPAHGDPILSAMYLVKDLLLYEYSRKLRERPPSLGERMRHLGNIVGKPLRLAGFGRKWVRRRILAERKLPSVVLGSPSGAYALEFHAEQAPNGDSRITLADTRDSLGMRRLRVDWRTSDLDVGSLERSYGLLAAELQRTGVGALDYEPGEASAKALAAGAYGGHHLGGARMTLFPHDGVVDVNCRAHGVGNLYLATSAVFPTSSQANPSLTILALSLRLADRLRLEFERP